MVGTHRSEIRIQLHERGISRWKQQQFPCPSQRLGAFDESAIQDDRYPVDENQLQHQHQPSGHHLPQSRRHQFAEHPSVWKCQPGKQPQPEAADQLHAECPEADNEPDSVLRLHQQRYYRHPLRRRADNRVDLRKCAEAEGSRSIDIHPVAAFQRDNAESERFRKVCKDCSACPRSGEQGVVRLRLSGLWTETPLETALRHQPCPAMRSPHP